MSFDLFFTPREGIRVEDFQSYFRGRKHYANGESFYENKDTGVYFSFNFSNEDTDEECDEDGKNAPVTFNMNYCRPHVFAIEAAPEVEAFVKYFAMRVDDPQNDGMGSDATFTQEGFLKSWNAGNKFGYRAVLGSEGNHARPHALPSARIQAVWQWNFLREHMQEEIGPGVFVPRIFCVDKEGQLLTAISWGVEQTLIPRVDTLLLPCASEGPARKDGAAIYWDEVAPLLEQFNSVRSGCQCFNLDFETPPRDIAAFRWRRRPKAEGITGIAFDQVLDQELVDVALSRH